MAYVGHQNKHKQYYLLDLRPLAKPLRDSLRK